MLAAAIFRSAPLAVVVVDELLPLVVPFRAMADALNAVKFFGPLSTALMANTIPMPQCPV